MSREGGALPPQELASSSQKAKRQQVLAACQNCRQQKIKCDGQPICRECGRRNIQCVYATRVNESHGQAIKRRADELSGANQILQQIFKALGGQDEEQAVAIFRSIRAGQQPESILDDVLRGRTPQGGQTPYDPQLYEAFIIALVQSTARLDEIVDLAALALPPSSQIKLPPLVSYQSLMDSVLSLGTIRGMLAASNPGQRFQQEHVSRGSGDLHRTSSGAYSGPTFWVSASPWTSLTANDHAVSHLVTIFLTYINPYWRCVEEDLFLKSMRRPAENSTYCSSCLVHAILACASVYSEIDEAFAAPGNLLTRGDHFHSEAVRLWELEQGRESITSMQALLVLALGCLPRGKCQLGWNFVKKAAAQNKSLPIVNPEQAAEADARSAQYARARACASNSVVSANVAYALRLLARTNELEVSMEDLRELEPLLPDTQIWWIGYPLKQQPVALRANLLLWHRCQLTRFGWELLHILFSTQHPTPDQLWTAVAEFTERLTAWYETLPTDLQYTKSMASALYEFHAHTLCLFMALYHHTYQALFESLDTARDLDHSSEWPDATIRNELRRQKLGCAFKAAELSWDFGSEYGWKIAPLWIPHQVTGAIFIFLQEMQKSSSDMVEALSRTADIEGAFEECFRCLLGCGVQQMLSRGIARMIYHTVTKLELRLPRLVERMLQIVAEVAWQRSDLQYLDSIFPNPLIANNTGIGEARQRMGSLLREWEEGSD